MNQERAMLLFGQQQEVGNQIMKLHERFGKENRGRRTRASKLLEWRGMFNDEWTKFLDNHDELKLMFDQFRDEPYFKDSYYDSIKAYYEDVLTKINLIERQMKILPTISEEMGQAVDALAEVVNDHEEQEADGEGQGFVTTMGDMLASTPKSAGRRLFNNLLDRFQAISRKLLRQLAEIEDLALKGELARVNIVLKNVTQIWNDFNREYDELCASSNENEPEYYKMYQEVANQFFNINERFEKSTYNYGNKQNSVSCRSNQVKLEPVKIPRFHGSYEAWPTFSGLFETLVMSNESFSDIEKMQYLKTIVAGEAERAISSLTISGENFNTAWQILRARFDNKQAIIANQISRILDLNRVQEDSVQKLQTFHDKAKEYVALLRNVSAEQWLVHILKHKLDRFTRNLYEQRFEDKEKKESIEDFFSFLQYRCRSMEFMDFDFNKNKERYKSNTKPFNQRVRDQACVCCGKDHAIYFCEKFKSMKVSERSETVKNKSLCILCLRPNHKSSECLYKSMCPTCGKRHNGLLHFEKSNSDSKSSKKSYVAVTTESVDQIQTGAYTVKTDVHDVGALLATALVRVKTAYGWSPNVRVLIDQGSMITFITERAVNAMNLSKRNNKIDICGIAGSVESARSTVDVEFTARYPTSFAAKCTAVVLGKLTTLLPGHSFDKSFVSDKRFNDLILADPKFNERDRIDMILGADVYADIILNGFMKAADNSFVAQETEVGWIISGPICRKTSCSSKAVCMVGTTTDIDLKMQKFWEMEEIYEQRAWTAEEKDCVKQFEATIKRGVDGVYSVSLPFKCDTPALGNSRRMALAQFHQLERKLEKDELLRKLYVDYMDEMLKRGYLKECTLVPDSSEEVYYLPHHPVMKNSSTTKVRPVFDASRKTTNGISLNDLLHTGPRLQDELFDILVRFRTHKIAFGADIEKMYLHVNLNGKHRDYQRIIWRKRPSDVLKTYHLTTVTFGVSSSPFLAVATMQYHAKKESSKYPEACRIILQDTYMDDVSSGCDSVDEAVKLQKEVTQILADAGFPLRKWISNSEELMEKIPQHEKEGVAVEVRGGFKKYVTTLGIPWFFGCDKLVLNLI